jgi:hypothetical protein
MLLIHIVGMAFDNNYKISNTCKVNMLVVIVISFFSNDYYKVELMKDEED